MTAALKQQAEALRSHFGDKIKTLTLKFNELTLEVEPEDLREVCTELRDQAEFGYEQLVDLCGVDYSQFGKGEWETDDSTSTGFSRGVEAASMGRLKFGDELSGDDNQAPRFASVMHLTSYRNNSRLRVKTFAASNDFPVVPSVTEIWQSANWYERESFDLYGIHYSDHPDLRRILTDYGFVGHPFRKDFPLVGHVEMRYDPEQKRVIYEPVSIDPRVLVPRVQRDDHRYLGEGGSEEAASEAS